MDEGKVDPTALPPPTIKTRDSQGSPLAILAIALASGIGYVSWKWWKRWQGEKKYREFSPTGQESTAKSRSTCFAFDKQPISALSTSGRPASSNSTRRPSRQDPKPKSQKQLRKQAKKAAREQAVQNAESGAVAAAIAKRAKELGLGNQPPELPKQYYVDYEGVSQGYDKIVAWQQTGKKQY
ncbi:hypothetical protein Vretimale_14252 [Volvox reticuliferus]|uniref:Uncharacterized protein n=1 Tax=Volvox reticuliferus TaxID=1737510 RepID=A0A8J4GPC3_9CHLO|nr:hypothetical protein Vretifemale_15250 [Volvox reticuliferus]GIM10656.1 hypothetical protein Vretimale_14252 [Volvox reticuliferus]